MGIVDWVHVDWDGAVHRWKGQLVLKQRALLPCVLHCYTTTLLHCYTTTLLHYYTATLLHCNTTTLLLCYTATLLHYYTAILLHGYSATLLHCYSTTRLHGYTTTLLLYSSTPLLHCDAAHRNAHAHTSSSTGFGGGLKRRSGPSRARCTCHKRKVGRDLGGANVWPESAVGCQSIGLDGRSAACMQARACAHCWQMGPRAHLPPCR